jgi:hypothetical protein
MNATKPTSLHSPRSADSPYNQNLHPAGQTCEITPVQDDRFSADSLASLSNRPSTRSDTSYVTARTSFSSKRSFVSAQSRHSHTIDEHTPGQPIQDCIRALEALRYTVETRHTRLRNRQSCAEFDSRRSLGLYLLSQRAARLRLQWDTLCQAPDQSAEQPTAEQPTAEQRQQALIALRSLGRHLAPLLKNPPAATHLAPSYLPVRLLALKTRSPRLRGRQTWKRGTTILKYLIDLQRTKEGRNPLSAWASIHEYAGLRQAGAELQKTLIDLREKADAIQPTPAESQRLKSSGWGFGRWKLGKFSLAGSRLGQWRGALTGQHNTRQYQSLLMQIDQRLRQFDSDWQQVEAQKQRMSDLLSAPIQAKQPAQPN